LSEPCTCTSRKLCLLTCLALTHTAATWPHTGPLPALGRLTSLRRLDLNWVEEELGGATQVWTHPLLPHQHQQAVAGGQQAGNLVAAAAAAGGEGLEGGEQEGHHSVVRKASAGTDAARMSGVGCMQGGLCDMVAGKQSLLLYLWQLPPLASSSAGSVCCNKT
jgi:hypothetical protein